jgi:hypothetical protein
VRNDPVGQIKPASLPFSPGKVLFVFPFLIAGANCFAGFGGAGGGDTFTRAGFGGGAPRLEVVNSLMTSALRQLPSGQAEQLPLLPAGQTVLVLASFF